MDRCIFRYILKHILFPAKMDALLHSLTLYKIRCDKGKLNVMKRSKCHCQGVLVLLTGLWNLKLTTASLSGGGCPGCPGASTFGTANPQTELCPHGWQTCALQPWAPTPMEPGTRHTDLTVEELRGGRDGGKRMIQRLNEENGRHENTVLSTWRWCKQGWPRLSQTTDCWPCPHSFLLTVSNKYLFNLMIF